MVEAITDNLYRIGVPLPENPLKELNSYFLKGEERDLLIDTGFKRPECRVALSEGLQSLGSRRERRDVFITHVHSDHSGLATEMAGDHCIIYMSPTDKRQMIDIIDGTFAGVMQKRFMEEGFPKEKVLWVSDHNPARIYAFDSVDDRFLDVSEGDVITVGSFRLKVISVPGHTPGNCMLWLEKEGIMFTGDHVLFDITPNITAFTMVDDSLGDYMESLKKAENYPVRLALPGHRKPGDYQKRVKALYRHHEKRLENAYRIVKEHPGSCAYDIAGMMRWEIRAKDWESFPDNQKWYAVGECLSHLDYLRKRGKIRREMQNGIWRYEVT